MTCKAPGERLGHSRHGGHESAGGQVIRGEQKGTMWLSEL